MDSSRRVEKRTRLLEQLRREYLAFGIREPLLPDCDWPKRRFEKAAFEAREVLRQLKEKLLGSICDYLTDLNLDLDDLDSETTSEWCWSNKVQLSMSRNACTLQFDRAIWLDVF